MILYFFCVLTVVSAFYAVYKENLVHAVFSLLLAFFGMAGLFVYLNADFLAALQILIYVGGILVLFLFGVMFTQHIYNIKISVKPISRFTGMLLSAIFFILFFGIVIGKSKFLVDGGTIYPSSVQSIGHLLLTKYVLPFEVTSVLLVACMVGVILITMRKD